jgi:hypothetical protein
VKGSTNLRESNETETDAPAACLKAKTTFEVVYNIYASITTANESTMTST